MGSPVPVAMAQPDGDPGPVEIFTGPCAFCGRPCGEDDYCFGCRAMVCDRCDRRPSATDLFKAQHPRSQHGAVERRDLMREVDRGRAAILTGRFEEVVGALNSIEALLRS